MICSNCGTENENGFKFCVKCGSNLEDPAEVNYEQVDRGNYHSEEEFSGDNAGFTMDSGTFVIRDTSPPAHSEQNLYTADELNDSEEEFDFSMYDDPAIPPLTPPPVQQNPQPVQQPVYNQTAQLNPQGIQPQGFQQPIQGMNPYMNQPQMMYAQPQIIGYDPNGMPIYGQPQMMYAQPQIIGYDPNGMPIYGQPQMMYAQPQIIGYDPNGMPVYGQPPVQGTPNMQVPQGMNGMPNMQYPNGMPGMQSPQGMQGIPNVQNPNGMSGVQSPQGMQGIPNVQSPNGMPGMQSPQRMQGIPNIPQTKEAPSKSKNDDFWAFFDGEKSEEHTNDTNDFFGKAHSEPTIPDDPFADIDNRRKKRKQAEAFMSDTPIVDGDKLAKNDSDRINKLYMRQTGAASADLTVGSGKKSNGSMDVTKEVNADLLTESMKVKSRISMQYAGEANPDEIEAYVPKHKESIMAQADHAVEALPKKVNPYESELDKIELPEYMKAKKTVREETVEIPSLPEV